MGKRTNRNSRIKNINIFMTIGYKDILVIS